MIYINVICLFLVNFFIFFLLSRFFLPLIKILFYNTFFLINQFSYLQYFFSYDKWLFFLFKLENKLVRFVLFKQRLIKIFFI